ncbi:S8 family serine peptidase [bacterium]|nr:S8 family serine peptidase [bacterium]
MEDQLWYERLPNMTMAGRIKQHLLRLLLTLQLIALLPLASCSAPTTNPVSVPYAQNVQPLLLSLATEEPNLVPRLIVQLSSDSAEVTSAVTTLGGQVLSKLEIINALVVELPATHIPALADIAGVRWISLDAPVLKSGELGADVVLREDFAMMEPGSTRSVDWRWSEVGENDGMEDGDVALTMFYGGQQEGLRIKNGNRGIETEINLLQSTIASMNIGYRRKDFSAGDAVRIEISRDGGASWQLLESLTGPITDAAPIVAGYDLGLFTGYDLKLRFISNESMSTNARFYLDFVQVSYNVVQPDYRHQLLLPHVSAPQPVPVNNVQSVFSAGTTVNARDEFGVVSYQNNYGVVAWKGDWIEVDPDGFPGPSGGDYIGINNGRLQFHNTYRNHEMISRSVDLSHGKDAILSFNWETRGLDFNELLSLMISTSSSGPFTLLTTFGGTDRGTYSVDISKYISDDTTIRFVNRNFNWEWGEFAFIDNVNVQWASTNSNNSQPPVEACTDCIDTSAMQTVFPKVVGASDIWNDEVRKQGEGITVAVVDSGIAVHPDLTNKAGNSRVLAHVDFTIGGTKDDYFGHGTHIAGAIAGNGKKSYGTYIGIAPLADLVDVRVTDDYGVGSTSSVVAGLEWILANKDKYNIRVVNMSLNSTVAESYHTSALNAAVEILWFNGIVVVVSSGNNGDNDDAGILYPPANDPFVITVGATDDKWTIDVFDDTLAPFTAFGFTSERFMKPEIMAPGTNIIASLASDDANLAINHPSHKVQGTTGAFYFRMSGTSMASAVAAGTVALLLSSEPTLTPNQVKYRLMHTGRPFAEAMAQQTCDLKIYTNEMGIGWQFSSLEASVATDAQGLAVTYTGPQGTLFLNAEDLLDTTPFASIRFLAYGSPQGNTIRVVTYGNDNKVNTTTPYWKFLPPNQWTQVVIPLSSLGSVSQISRIAILGGTSAAQSTFYLKDIAVVGPCSGISYLDIKAATRANTTQYANQDVVPHMLLAKMAMIAYWAHQNGGDEIDWSSVNWNSVNWNSVNWNSVNWNSVNWNSVNWNSVNWNSVNWNSVNWNSVNWNSVNWNSVKRNSVYWED